MNIIYKKQISLYGNEFLTEYNRVSILVKRLNAELGFPIYKLKIDVLNSELIVENRFSSRKRNSIEFYSKIKGVLNYAG